MKKVSKVILEYSFEELKQIIVENLKSDYPNKNFEVNYNLQSVCMGYGTMESYQTVFDNVTVTITDKE